MAIDSVHGLIGLMIAKRKRRGRDSNSAVNRRPLSKFHVFNTVQRKAFGPMHAFPGHMLARHGIIVVPRAVLNPGVIIGESRVCSYGLLSRNLMSRILVNNLQHPSAIPAKTS